MVYCLSWDSLGSLNRWSNENISASDLTRQKARE